MLKMPFNPIESLQLNNKYWPSEKFNNISLISDLENSIDELGYLSSSDLLKRCASLLPREARKSFLFLVARERLFRTEFGIHFYSDLPLMDLGEKSTLDVNSHYFTPDKSSQLRAFEKAISVRFKECFGFDLIKMHRQIRFAEPDAKTKELDQYGVLSDFHNDEAKGLTTMIYLSDVAELDNGAFQYIEGSHQIPRSVVLTAAHIAVGFTLGLTDPAAMNCLPLEFRGNPGVGNFLDPDKAELLHSSVRHVLGDRGTAWTFNGHLLLHRGGKVKKGSRKAYFLQPEGKVLFKVKTAFNALLPSRLVASS